VNYQKAFFSGALLLITLSGVAEAKEIQWKKSPIQTHWSFWGMDYRLADQKLDGFQDFADALGPLKDAQANQLLARSEDSALWGGAGRIAGTLAAGWGGAHLLFDDSASTHGAHVAVLLSGLGVDLLAALFLEDSQKAKYNAVQRYNEVVRGEDNSLPSLALPQDEKNLLPSSK
jgi:hypothetical protein